MSCSELVQVATAALPWQQVSQFEKQITMTSHHHFSLENLSSKASSIRSRSSKTKSKYENVTPKTNTGYHIGRLLEDYDSVQRNFRFRPDEIFRRIKISLLVALIAECALLEHQLEKPESNVEEETGDKEDAGSNKVKFTPYFPFNALNDGGGEAKTNHKSIPSYERSYLLLDVRDTSEFAASHIITAENYPKTNLSRANFETPSLLKYRNHPSHIIILYDDDETSAPQAATTLIERDYENVFVLSGGIKVAKQCFPHSLLVGQEGTQSVSPETAKILMTQLQQMSYRYKK